VRHECRTEQALCFPLNVLDRFHHLDAAGLAAPAGVNLRLDDPDRAAEFLCGLDGFIDREGRQSVRNRHAKFREDRFRLVLVDVHGRPRVRV